MCKLLTLCQVCVKMQRTYKIAELRHHIRAAAVMISPQHHCMQTLQVQRAYLLNGTDRVVAAHQCMQMSQVQRAYLLDGKDRVVAALPGEGMCAAAVQYNILVFIYTPRWQSYLCMPSVTFCPSQLRPIYHDPGACMH